MLVMFLYVCEGCEVCSRWMIVVLFELSFVCLEYYM